MNYNFSLYLNLLNQISKAIYYLNQYNSDSIRIAIEVLVNIEDMFIVKITEMLQPFNAKISYMWDDESEGKIWKIVW